MTNNSEIGVLVQNVSKIYGVCKPFVALDNISFKIKRGDVLGLLGHNGAGKTTLIKILTTLLEPTFGKVVVNGFDLCENPTMIKYEVGYMTQDISLDPNLTVGKTLQLQSMYYGIFNNKKRIDYLLGIIDLFKERDVVVRKLSGGMKRRLMIAKALVHNPSIVILDEPTVGIDITIKEKIISAVKILRDEGKTVILTTHSFDEVQQLCTLVSVLQDGKQVYFNTIEAVQKTITQDIITFTLDVNTSATDHNKALQHLKNKGFILDKHIVNDKSSEKIITLKNNSYSIEIVLSLLAQAKIPILRVDQPSVNIVHAIENLMRKYTKMA
ncbi:MAG: ABC transporter ATP-binding protein [Alphaproteobacteria bacterium]|nr:ABC transporter ATP-binding protein [Rickettsiales bacterium]